MRSFKRARFSRSAAWRAARASLVRRRRASGGDIEEHLTEYLRRFVGGAGLERDLRQHGEAEVDVGHGAEQGRVIGAQRRRQAPAPHQDQKQRRERQPVQAEIT
jgi:hypothetical protein